MNRLRAVAVEEGASALEALDRLEHGCLVLLDLVMPGMNGWDFFTEMRSRPEFASIPVIVHSSAPARAPQGVTSVLRKPMELQRLLAVVQEYCPK